jgi:release factor glutamine methyltransferase
VSTDELVTRLRAAGCVFAEDEARLLMAAADGPEQLAELTARREAGAPLEVLLGWVEFRGRRVGVAPGVFVPRRRTAFLVTTAVRVAGPTPVVLDLCCGTGAVGLALATELTGVELHAADVDPAAVACAAANLAGVGLAHLGDLFAPLPPGLRGRVDLLVANAPYVPTEAIATMPPEAREHEPMVALDGGPDGLDLHRRIAAGAPDWLAPGGFLLIETSLDQAPRTAAVCAAAGLRPSVHRSEDEDATVVLAGNSAAEPDVFRS